MNDNQFSVIAEDMHAAASEELQARKNIDAVDILAEIAASAPDDDDDDSEYLARMDEMRSEYEYVRSIREQHEEQTEMARPLHR